MRIHFGITHGKTIKWPDRCLWCDAKEIVWQKYRKKSLYDYEYRIFWVNVMSRIMTIYYPLCRRHNLIADFLRPSRLLFFTFVMFFAAAIAHLEAPWWYLLSLLPLAGYFYYKKHGLIIHVIGERHIELSIPEVG